MARTEQARVRIETLPPMRVAWFRAVGKEPEPLAIGVMDGWLLDQRQRRPAALRLFGFDAEVSAADRTRGFRAYEVWAPVPPGVRPGGGMRVRQVPGGSYAVLRVRDALVDPYARIPSGWKRLWGWVKRSREYRLTEGPCLEEHVREGGSIHLDLFMPVAPAPKAQPRRRPVPR